MLNKIMMTGRIVTDLTVVTEDNYSYCKFSIAVDQPNRKALIPLRQTRSPALLLMTTPSP
mgnify:CR=1 FL=1